MFRHMFVFMVALCGLLTGSAMGAFAEVQTIAGDSTRNPAHDDKAALKLLSWQLPMERVTTQITSYLKGKIGKEVTRPSYPTKRILYWQRGRYPMRPPQGIIEPEHFQSLYRLLYEDTLVLQHLMKAISVLEKRGNYMDERGRQIVAQRAREIQDMAYHDYMWASLDLNDKWLGARIAEAFMLRHLEAAPTQATEYLNRETLVETAAGAFWEAGERDKQIATLGVLIKTAHYLNTADATRAKIADALASQGKFDEAISSLEPIRDPSISALKEFLIAKYKEQKQTKEKRDKEQLPIAPNQAAKAG